MAYLASSGPKWNTTGRSTHFLLIFTLVFSLLSSVHAYFIVNQPGSSTLWANGSPYPLQWTKGLNDGIGSFDLEIARLSQDGLYLIAQNVPTTHNTLNILMQDVPEGDDYFVVCLNSVSGVIYSVSSRFSITNSSVQNPYPDSSVPTVTISGAPSPTSNFATTLGPPVNGARSLLFSAQSLPNSPVFGFEGVLVLCAVFLGGAMTLW